jgi:hypothetical protein
VVEWIHDKNTPAYRLGLYSSVLAHASKKPEEHGKLLRSLVEDPEKRVSGGVDGILASQVILQPKEGWAYLKGILGDRKHDFNYRYAALKATRFFIDFRADLIPRQEVIDSVKQLLAQPDIADLGIEDLRRWKVWDLTPRVLELKDKPAYDLPVMRRAILRFMLCSPAKGAKEYVAEMRKQDEELVNSIEDLLKVEQATVPPTSRPPGSN